MSQQKTMLEVVDTDVTAHQLMRQVLRLARKVASAAVQVEIAEHIVSEHDSPHSRAILALKQSMFVVRVGDLTAGTDALRAAWLETDHAEEIR